MKTIYIFLLASLTVLFADAAVFYVDPVNGSMSGEGSAADPWKTLEEVFNNDLIETNEYKTLPYTPGGELKIKNAGAPVKAGDTIMLRSGYHGDAYFRRGYNSKTITIMAVPGHTPYLKKLYLGCVGRWKIEGLTVSPELAPAADTIDNIIFIEGNWYDGYSYEVSVENCTVYTVQDASSWTAQEWLDKAACGIKTLRGVRHTIRNNTVRNVTFGVFSLSDSTMVSGNYIKNFSRDGIRCGGTDQVIVKNSIINNIKVDDHHDDGIQVALLNGKITYRMTFRGNYILNYEDPDMPLRGPLQGLVSFDDPAEDWIIENNVVIVDHWHGISLYNSTNSKIFNNTVVPTLDATTRQPWITIGAKSGHVNFRNILRNNIADRFPTDADPDAIKSNNIEFNPEDLPLLFHDYMNYDLTLSSGSAAIDAGTTLDAPLFDFSGTSRPQGETTDVGAYEYIPVITAIDFQEFENIKVYPNPSKGIFTVVVDEINGDKISFELYSFSGKRILKNDYSLAHTLHERVDIQHLEKGIYFIKIVKKDKTSFLRLILE